MSEFNHSELFKGGKSSPIFKLSLDAFKAQVEKILLQGKVQAFRYALDDFETAMARALGKAPKYPAFGFRIDSIDFRTDRPNAKLELRSGIFIGTDEQGNNIKLFPVPVTAQVSARYVAQTESELLALVEAYHTARLEESLSFNLKPKTREPHHTTESDIHIKVLCASESTPINHPSEGSDATGAELGSVDLTFSINTMFGRTRKEKIPDKIILEFIVEGVDPGTSESGEELPPLTFELVPPTTDESFRA